MNIIEKINNFVSESEIFDETNVEEVYEKIEEGIKAPWVKVFKTSIGKGKHIIFKVSLDKKEDWPNNIYENSRNFQFSLDADSTKSNLELYTKDYKIKEKFRKTKVKSVEDAIKKVNIYLEKAKKESE